MNIEGIGAFIFCISTRNYLFVKRNNCRHSGTWGLAGGKIEIGEFLIDSLTRELSEELGVSIISSKIVPLEKFTSYERTFSYHTFLITVAVEFIPVLNEEHSDFLWTTLSEVPKNLHPGVSRTLSNDQIVHKIKTLESLLTSS